MFLHHVPRLTGHTYCALFSAIGSSLSFEVSSFKKTWILLRPLWAITTMLLWVYSLSYLVGFQHDSDFYLSLIVEFTLVYVIWLVSHHFYKNKFKKSTKALLTTKQKILSATKIWKGDKLFIYTEI